PNHSAPGATCEEDCEVTSAVPAPALARTAPRSLEAAAPGGGLCPVFARLRRAGELAGTIGGDAMGGDDRTGRRSPPRGRGPGPTWLAWSGASSRSILRSRALRRCARGARRRARRWDPAV